MKTVTIRDHDYHGPTSNPHGEALARLSHQFRNVRGPQQLRSALKAWGLTDEISPRQARFWADSAEGERRTFCRIAGLRFDYVTRDWAGIPPKDRAAIWQAIGDAATWGERLKGRW